MTSMLSSIHGCILGTIVGDAVGLPYEALSRRRGQRLFGPPDRHRFVLGRGMMSDDGEHTCLVAQAICDAGASDVAEFRRSLARRLRWWLLGLPAGIGGATLRSVLKLWLGMPPHRSGVFSAGNGPAMRSAVIGVAIEDPVHLREFVAASTLVTHTDPKAFHGAMAVALAARCARDGVAGDAFLERVRTALADDEADELLRLLESAQQSALAMEATTTFAERIGCERGVSGYVYRTVPVAIHAWLRNPSDFAAAVGGAIACGGDTDTVAAIAGGIVGSGVGIGGIPAAWRSGMLEWPRSNVWVAKLARAVNASAIDSTPATPPAAGPMVVLRNLLFTIVVLTHIARRAFPPYR